MGHVQSWEPSIRSVGVSQHRPTVGLGMTDPGDEDASGLFCAACGAPATFNGLDELTNCKDCGSLHATTDKPDPKPLKPYKLSQKDRIMLRVNKIKPDA